jgi:rod shape-determining protein MreC
MQRLIAFIEHNLHILLLVFLQVVSAFLIFNLNPYQKATFTQFASSVTGRFHAISFNVTNYFDLKKQNIALQEQIANQFKDRYPQSLNYLNDTIAIQDSINNQLFEAIPVHVIYNTSFKVNNVFIINKGKNHGIKKNMGVISPQGVAGIVLESNDNFSTVMSLLNSEMKIIPYINGQEYFTELIWNNSNPNHLTLKGINKLENIQLGDTVYTGNSSLLFPRGIPIGSITKIKENPKSQYAEMELKTVTNFRNLAYAFVIVNRDYESLNNLFLND